MDLKIIDLNLRPFKQGSILNHIQWLLFVQCDIGKVFKTLLDCLSAPSSFLTGAVTANPESKPFVNMSVRSLNSYCL